MLNSRTWYTWNMLMVELQAVPGPIHLFILKTYHVVFHFFIWWRLSPQCLHIYCNHSFFLSYMSFLCTLSLLQALCAVSVLFHFNSCLHRPALCRRDINGRKRSRLQFPCGISLRRLISSSVGIQLPVWWPTGSVSLTRAIHVITFRLWSRVCYSHLHMQTPHTTLSWQLPGGWNWHILVVFLLFCTIQFSLPSVTYPFGVYQDFRILCQEFLGNPLKLVIFRVSQTVLSL